MSNIRYRMRTLDSLVMAKEIFHDSDYDKVLSGIDDINTFVDLGCNCGYFSCYMLDKIKNHDANIILIDADPNMAKEASWHMKNNNAKNAVVLNGLAGSLSAGETSKFYLRTNASGSSNLEDIPTEFFASKQAQIVEISNISVDREWKKAFGERPCDLVKVDIEGAEFEFLKAEIEFIRSCRYFCVEIHKWHVDVASVHNTLSAVGFELHKSVSENDFTELRSYKKATSR